MAQKIHDIMQKTQQKMMQDIQQIFDKFTVKFIKKMEVISKTLIKQLSEFFTLFPAEHFTKPAFQHFMEFTPPQLPPPVSELMLPQLLSEPFTPHVARVAKKHHFGVHTRHRVIERIGFRFYSSPRASRSAFVRLGLYPAATPPFSSWTFNVVPCIGQWEPSDHG